MFGYGLDINADQNKQSEAWAHNNYWHILKTLEINTFALPEAVIIN